VPTFCLLNEFTSSTVEMLLSTTTLVDNARANSV
jgi:hypothetical protein